MKLIESQFGKIRITEIDGKEFGSVYDMLSYLGISRTNKVYTRIYNQYPMFAPNGDNLKSFKFEGRGQRETPVADLKTLFQIAGKTKEGANIDDAAYQSLSDILTNPEETIKTIDRIHGEGTAKRTIDYLDSYHGMTKALDSKITETNKRGVMIGTVNKHNNISVGLAEKKDRDNMNENQQSVLTAIQALQRVKMNTTDSKDWKAVNECKKTTNEVLNLLNK